MSAKRNDRQRKLVFVEHGGKRDGAGRKLAPGKRRSVAHRSRINAFDKPSHVTLRVADDIRSLRESKLYLVIENAIRAGKDRFGFRVIAFSVQSNHLHFVVEADTRVALSRGMQGGGDELMQCHPVAGLALGFGDFVCGHFAGQFAAIKLR